MSVANVNSNVLNIPWFELLFMEKGEHERTDCVGQFVASLKFLVLLYCRAIRAFLASDLQSFDAQVGENACELRMFILLRLHDRDGFRDDISTVLNRFEFALTRLDELNLSNLVLMETSRGGILASMPDIDVSSSLSFLVNCKFLSEIDYNSELHIFSYRKFKTQQRRMQARLSYICVTYMQTCISEESNLNDSLISFASSKFIRLDSYGRSALPCYFTLKSILIMMWREKRLVLFKCIRAASTLHPGPCQLLLYEPTGESFLSYKRVPLLRHLDASVAVFEVKASNYFLQTFYICLISLSTHLDCL